MKSSYLILNIASDHFLYHPVKPEITFGNYFFRWDEKAIGIYSNEISDFKSFIKKMIPNLEVMMKSVNISKNPKEKGGQLKKETLERGQFSISNKDNNNIKFILYVDVNGSAIFYREEKILMDNKIYNKKNKKEDNFQYQIRTITTLNLFYMWMLMVQQFSIERRKF